MGADQPLSGAAKQELQVYKRADGKTDWRLVVNSDIVATSGGQGYESPADALEMGSAVVHGRYSNCSVEVLS
jgi:uncharacterized protein YegP (UPF0339 family)